MAQGDIRDMLHTAAERKFQEEISRAEIHGPCPRGSLQRLFPRRGPVPASLLFARIFTRIPFRVARVLPVLFVLSRSLTQSVYGQDIVPEEYAPAARPDSSTLKRDRGGWTLGAYLGIVRTGNSSITVSQPSLGNHLTFQDVRFEDRSFDDPLYYGIRLGYFIPPLPSVGVEAEFIHMKVYTDPEQRVSARGTFHGQPLSREIQLKEVVQQYAISHGLNFIIINVVARYAIDGSDDCPHGRAILAARCGLGPTWIHTESVIDNQEQEQHEMGRVGWQVAAGIEIKLLGGLYATGEYKFTGTSQEGSVYAGSVETLIRSHHAAFGLSHHW